MKDLIAKLQMDANCALGAIWMHIDAQEKRIAELERQLQDHSAQAFSIGETYANALSRIAELEAQIAAASVPVVEQQPSNWISTIARACNLAGVDYVTFLKIKAYLPVAPQPADTDKLREAISDEQIMRIAGDVKQRNARVWPGDVAFARAVLASTALQAPVREVPEDFQSVPKNPTQVMRDAGNAKLRLLTDEPGMTVADRAFYCYIAMIAAAPLPAAPVQQEG